MNTTMLPQAFNLLQNQIKAMAAKIHSTQTLFNSSYVLSVHQKT